MRESRLLFEKGDRRIEIITWADGHLELRLWGPDGLAVKTLWDGNVLTEALPEGAEALKDERAAG